MAMRTVRVRVHAGHLEPLERLALPEGAEKLPDGRRRQELAALAGSVLAAIPCESVPEAAGDA
jgi:hypothetical protein